MRVSSLFKLGRSAAGPALLAVPVPGLLLDEGLSLLGGTDQIMSGSVIAVDDDIPIVLDVVVGRWFKCQISSSPAASTRTWLLSFLGEHSKFQIFLILRDTVSPWHHSHNL
jgi:hypothetical protein